jgi:hypothetical protein
VDPYTDPAPTPAQHHSSVWWLVILTVLALILLVAGVWAKYYRHTSPVASMAATTLSPAEYEARITHPNTVFDITIDDGKLIKGPSKITVKQGDAVRVNIHAVGEEANLQLDGYGIITESDPSDDTPGGFSFVADKQGTFKFYSLGEANPDGVTPPQKTLLGEIIVR